MEKVEAKGKSQGGAGGSDPLMPQRFVYFLRPRVNKGNLKDSARRGWGLSAASLPSRCISSIDENFSKLFNGVKPSFCSLLQSKPLLIFCTICTGISGFFND